MDELLGIRVPQSPQAEQAVIGSMLIDPSCIPDVLRDVRAEHFYNRTNRDIFETIFTMFNYGQTIDPVTVVEQMKERGVFREDSTKSYFVELMNATPTAANVKQYCAIVHDKALMRNLATNSEEITAMVYEGVGTAREMLEVAEFLVVRGDDADGDEEQHDGAGGENAADAPRAFLLACPRTHQEDVDNERHRDQHE